MNAIQPPAKTRRGHRHRGRRANGLYVTNWPVQQWQKPIARPHVPIPLQCCAVFFLMTDF